MEISMDENLKSAIVTGGASGIGKATVMMLAEQGYHVWAGDIQITDETQSDFAERGIHFRHCDVRNEQHVIDLISNAATATGRIDLLVNNAGVGMVKAITDVASEEWDLCLDTNLKAAFLTCKYTIPRMAPEGGSIVNIASNAGLLPRAHDPVYSISKAALIALTKSLALCHSADKIRVNCVCPGPVGDTGMINADIAAATDPAAFRESLINASPLARASQRMISPREVATTVVYLASEDSQMITGTAVAIDGGKSLGVPPGVPTEP
jgi:NAD(P)-dependent dehydrogenase (short-subunit alcohol dehydrogenase family)